VLVNKRARTGVHRSPTIPPTWDKVLDLNLKSPFFLTRACLRSDAAATADDHA
jgi:NAD(P)-dependent dehydrogenase (short-subunit alcohol dehydrogenase family)